MLNKNNKAAREATLPGSVRNYVSLRFLCAAQQFDVDSMDVPRLLNEMQPSILIGKYE